MYSVETLARVDTLCLDKTGTITQGKMTVESLHSLSDHFSEQTIQVILSAYMQYSEDTNPTAQAIRKAYGELEHAYTAENIIPFSSDRKWGAMHLSNLGTVFLGAPEMLLKNPAACRRSTSSWIARARLGSQFRTDQHAGIETAWKILKGLQLLRLQTPFVKGLQILLSICALKEWISKSSPVTTPDSLLYRSTSWLPKIMRTTSIVQKFLMTN